jgi:hypothetical protein
MSSKVIKLSGGFNANQFDNRKYDMRKMILAVPFFALGITSALANPATDRAIGRWAACFDKAGSSTFAKAKSNPSKAQQMYRLYKSSCRSEYANAYRVINAEGGQQAVAAFERNHDALVIPRYIAFLDAFGLTHQ